MAERLTELTYPGPRVLRDARACRRELCLLYREGKSGLLDPALLGKLITCINAVQQLDNGRVLEDRLAQIEEQIATLKAARQGAKQ